MPNQYPYCGDRQLEPDDDTGAELAREHAVSRAWDDLLDDGMLPDGSDASTLMDAYLDADEGVLLDLLKAHRNGWPLEDTAKRIATKLEALAEDLIDGKL